MATKARPSSCDFRTRIPWIVAEDGEDIEYEHVFYRTDAFSVREYDPL